MACVKETRTCLGRWKRLSTMLLSQSWKGGCWNRWSLMDDDLGWENTPMSVRNRSTAALCAACQHTWLADSVWRESQQGCLPFDVLMERRFVIFWQQKIRASRRPALVFVAAAAAVAAAMVSKDLCFSWLLA